MTSEEHVGNLAHLSPRGALVQFVPCVHYALSSFAFDYVEGFDHDKVALQAD